MKLPRVCFIVALAAVLAGSLSRTSEASRRMQQKGAGSDMPGLAVYDKTCSRCHGAKGQDGKAPTLVPFRWNYAQALDIVRHGGACGMPAFTESELSDEALKQIVDYLKTLE